MNAVRYKPNTHDCTVISGTPNDAYIATTIAFSTDMQREAGIDEVGGGRVTEPVGPADGDGRPTLSVIAKAAVSSRRRRLGVPTE